MRERSRGGTACAETIPNAHAGADAGQDRPDTADFLVHAKRMPHATEGVVDVLTTGAAVLGQQDVRAPDVGGASRTPHCGRSRGDEHEPPGRDYSARNDSSGLDRAARHAGSADAISAAAITVPTPATYTDASSGLTV